MLLRIPIPGGNFFLARAGIEAEEKLSISVLDETERQTHGNVPVFAGPRGCTRVTQGWLTLSTAIPLHRSNAKFGSPSLSRRPDALAPHAAAGRCRKTLSRHASEKHSADYAVSARHAGHFDLHVAGNVPDQVNAVGEAGDRLGVQHHGAGRVVTLYVLLVPGPGVPLSTPVSGLKFTPIGKPPLILSAGAGLPEAVTVNVPGDPTANVVDAGLVNIGAICGAISKNAALTTAIARVVGHFDLHVPGNIPHQVLAVVKPGDGSHAFPNRLAAASSVQIFRLPELAQSRYPILFRTVDTPTRCYYLAVLEA